MASMEIFWVDRFGRSTQKTARWRLLNSPHEDVFGHRREPWDRLGILPAAQGPGRKCCGVCRQESDELASLGVRVEAGLELSDSQAIIDLIERLDGLQLHGVILNAGIQESMGLMELDPKGILRQFEVNALAPLLLVRALVGQCPAAPSWC